MTKKYLYLPIETKVREFDAKMLIAMGALECGYDVIIGEDTFLKKINMLPKGVLLHKDALSIRSALFKRGKSLGHKIAVNDEEGSVVHNWNRYLEKRVDKETLKYTDIFMCWGTNQYNSLINYSKNRDTFYGVTGHPRIDLLRAPFNSIYEEDLNKEKIILINTHFSLCNYMNGDEELILLFEKTKILSSPEDYDRHERHVKYKSELMEGYVKLIELISLKYPEYKIIIRPHPSENAETWVDLFFDKKNVIVTKKKSVGYWIKRALVVIHTGCTTAIEAFYSNKIAVSYKPIRSKEFEIYLPDSISESVETPDECLRLIHDVIEREFDFDFYFKKSSKILKNNIDTEKDFSYRKIIDLIETKGLTSSTSEDVSIKGIYYWLNKKRRLIKFIRKKIHLKNRNKFDDTTVVEVFDLMEKFNSIKSNEGELKCSVCEVLPNVFYLKNMK